MTAKQYAKLVHDEAMQSAIRQKTSSEEMIRYLEAHIARQKNVLRAYKQRRQQALDKMTELAVKVPKKGG